MIIYLYIKQHSLTGLKYFGKTVNKNPHAYAGSGKYWISHVIKHGGRKYIKTLEVYGFDDIKLLEEFAYNFSIQNDIHNSKDWANLIPETGRGGSIIGRKLSNETKIKISKSKLGTKHSEEAKQKMSFAKSKPRTNPEVWLSRFKDIEESLYPRKGYRKHLKSKWNVSISGVKFFVNEYKKYLEERSSSQ